MFALYKEMTDNHAEDESTIKEKAKIYQHPKKEYEVAVNDAAAILALQEPVLLSQRGKPVILLIRVLRVGASKDVSETL